MNGPAASPLRPLAPPCGNSPSPSPLLSALAAVPGVRSVTLTGSVVDRGTLAGASDLDTVVVCDKLTEPLFSACRGAAASVSAEALGAPGARVEINDTFGPLKFDAPGVLVIHLMVYDRAGHRAHVLRSPFTCHDWERSPVHAGESLAAIYPVLTLQPRDFAEARRGIRDYVADLDRGTLSYRRYAFGATGVSEVTERRPLDERHRGEYAYHIARNLVVNYAKLTRGDNRLWQDADLADEWEKLLPDCAGFVPFFRELARVKAARRDRFPPDTIRRVREFVQAFEASFRSAWDGVPCLRFVRHGATALNDGTFLGRGRDPGLAAPDAIAPLPEPPDRVVCSPLRRAVETARRLAPAAALVCDPRLAEIDYGAAEGLAAPELRRRHPEIALAWERGEDPPFPGGENTASVLARLRAFLRDHTRAGRTLVVTHNVVMRCLVGWLYRVPAASWYGLAIPHLAPADARLFGGAWHADFATEFKAAVTDSLVGWPHETEQPRGRE